MPVKDKEMRYRYEPQKVECPNKHGVFYICDHPLYTFCTLYKIGDLGLAVIQQHFDPVRKVTWWGEIDANLADALYLNSYFLEFFSKRAEKENDGIYPTVTIRQIMHALKMKPLKKERWETVFDRRDI